MKKQKEHPRYHVVSIRVSDAEKAYLLELTRRDRTTITKLMRAAIRGYLPQPATPGQR